ncbi:MAG: flippase-like domain-containing protein [Firmicutes bacterium]|nr:flippase-like domain-containing protein [Bacillota bacterium]
MIFKNNMINRKLLNQLLFTVIFIITSVLSLIFIHHIFGDRAVFLNLRIFSPEVLSKVIILLILYFLLDTLRLFYILKALNVNVDFKYIIKLAFINIFISNITPFASGGGFAQIYFLNKKGVAIGDATAASTIRTVIPIILFAVSTPIILAFDQSILKIFSNNNTLVYIGILIVIYILAMYIIWKLIKNPRTIKIILYKIMYFLEDKEIIKPYKTKRWIKKTFREIHRFSINTTRFFDGDKKYVSLSIVFTILFLLSLFSFSVILIRGLSPEASPLSIILSQIVITFGMYFAPTPGATGVAEGGFTLMFADFVKKRDIVSLIFAWRFFTIYLGMIIGMIIFYFEMFKNNGRDVRN